MKAPSVMENNTVRLLYYYIKPEEKRPHTSNRKEESTSFD
jgi:hypothetical protein